MSIFVTQFCRTHPWTPHANNGCGNFLRTYNLRVCDTAQPRRLPTNDEDRTRASTRNQKVPIKPNAVQKMYCHERSTKKSDHHGDATSLHIPTGGSSNRIWTSYRATNASEPFQLLLGDRQNRPRVKYSDNYVTIRTRRNPSPIIRATRKEKINRMRSRTDDFQRCNSVKTDHHFDIDSHIQQRHSRMETAKHQPQDMGRVQECLHQYYQKQRILVTIAGKRENIAAVHNIYSMPPTPPEEHREAIIHLNNIIKGMQKQSYKL